ncbi:MAG: preprotein translocase subunit SecY [Lentisphaeraceae bacterium]|nr:preprotein translocase subunit SecY [Lentisphaeraceae bacterium]
MLSAFKNIFKIKDLRSKIFYTLLMIAIVRLIQNIPVPGINIDELNRALQDAANNKASGGIVQMFNIFSGGALAKCAIGVLGIMPYITASIIMQLMTPVVPQIEKMQKEGVQGRQQYIQLTRYITIVICVVQGFLFAKGMPKLLQGYEIVNNPTMGFYITSTILLVASALLIMWLGEQITDKGIGQGASIIITISVISSMPSAIYRVLEFVRDDALTPIHAVQLAALFLFVTAATVMVVQGMRKIPLKYAKRTAGSRGAIEKTSYLPMKVNHAGVMPIIFAGPVMVMVGFVVNYLGLASIAPYISYGSSLYVIIFSILIILFTFFWVATQFNPIQIADDLNKSGGFIPGIRPGEPTSNFLNETMTKITFAGAVFLTVLAVFPIVLFSNIDLLASNQDITSLFGGTSLLIMVGVILQTMQQIEVQLVQHNYEGFVSSGRLRSRAG